MVHTVDVVDFPAVVLVHNGHVADVAFEHLTVRAALKLGSPKGVKAEKSPEAIPDPQYRPTGQVSMDL